MWNVIPIEGSTKPRYYVLDEENDLIPTTEEGWRAGKAEGQNAEPILVRLLDEDVRKGLASVFETIRTTITIG